jgi:hypothetical protein
MYLQKFWHHRARSLQRNDRVHRASSCCRTCFLPCSLLVSQCKFVLLYEKRVCSCLSYRLLRCCVCALAYCRSHLQRSICIAALIDRHKITNPVQWRKLLCWTVSVIVSVHCVCYAQACSYIEPAETAHVQTAAISTTSSCKTHHLCCALSNRRTFVHTTCTIQNHAVDAAV